MGYTHEVLHMYPQMPLGVFVVVPLGGTKGDDPQKFYFLGSGQACSIKLKRFY